MTYLVAILLGITLSFAIESQWHKKIESQTMNVWFIGIAVTIPLFVFGGTQMAGAIEEASRYRRELDIGDISDAIALPAILIAYVASLVFGTLYQGSATLPTKKKWLSRYFAFTWASLAMVAAIVAFVPAIVMVVSTIICAAVLRGRPTRAA